MKTIFDNDICIVVHDDLTFHPEKSDTSRVTGYLTFEKVMMAQEVWIYKPATKRFYAYKNRGLVNEVIHQALGFGINLKACAALADSAITSELRFATPKDQFYFELKF